MTLPRITARPSPYPFSLQRLPTATSWTHRRLATVSGSHLPGSTGSSSSSSGGQTLIEKIVQRYTVGASPGLVRQGDFVSIQPHHVLTHDNTAAVLSKYKAINPQRIFNPRQPVFAIDHDVQNTSPTNLAKYTTIRDFAHRHGIDYYPPGRGIGHQTMVEEAYALPYTLTVASDSHANMYGGLGCLGTPIVRTDAAAIWCTGQTWWQVPRVVHVELRGAPPRGVTGKDVILALCAHFKANQVLNAAVEFGGDGVSHLSVDERLAVANMTTEWGALAGVFPLTPAVVDQIQAEPLVADPDAQYAKRLTLDLASMQPYVSGPNSVKVATPVVELAAQHIKIHKAYLVSCVAPGVEFYVAPASTKVQQEAQARGDWQVLMQAGAIPLPAGCGPCVGLGMGLLKDGEVGISATNRNFKGRMGSPNAQAYLASPAVVMASALKGEIAVPTLPEYAELVRRSPPSAPQPVVSTPCTTTVDSATSPARTIRAPLVFCHQDNLNTDGIYPGKYTYQDSLTAAQMAAVVMENYDPAFPSLLNASPSSAGTILLAGFNFGTGSSREQAATALKAAGVRLVLAGSASETFKRNALNNGLLVLEAPALVKDAASEFGRQKLSVRTGWVAEVRLEEGKVVVSKGEQRVEYAIPRVGKIAQELMREGGLEGWVRKRLSQAAVADGSAASQAARAETRV
ncbi:homoaconitase [Catenaria anguillulae PL171]|uniref:Homoaconitase n=1 Tax=Catenaria anguillulae PL171 TaxID=765915 RepID=A0A1Y2I2Z0_9FUNG|nr:homoaconitase [Catenaria anguillulae PL171]